MTFLQLSTDQLAGSPASQSGSDHMLRRLCVESYGVLETYLIGDSRKNELYFVRFFDFFLKQFGQDVSTSYMFPDVLLLDLHIIPKTSECVPHIATECAYGRRKSDVSQPIFICPTEEHSGSTGQMDVRSQGCRCAPRGIGLENLHLWNVGPKACVQVVMLCTLPSQTDKISDRHHQR